MLEFFLGTFMGYTIGKAVGMSAKMLRKPDKILKWDSLSLGYRPVPLEAIASSGEDYLICYEVKSGDQKG